MIAGLKNFIFFYLVAESFPDGEKKKIKVCFIFHLKLYCDGFFSLSSEVNCSL